MFLGHGGDVRLCCIRTTWDNEIKFSVNHAPGAGSIGRLIDIQSSMLPLSYCKVENWTLIVSKLPLIFYNYSFLLPNDLTACNLSQIQNNFVIQTHHKRPPLLVESIDLGLDVISSKVSLVHHVITGLGHRLDTGLMTSHLSSQGLVLLHQVLDTDQVTACKNNVKNINHYITGS